MFIDKFNEIVGVSDSRDAPEKLMEILYQKEKREIMFDELLSIKKKDLSYDWFHEYFQEEHAQRKKHKQDFTPQQICEITSKLVSNSPNETYHESAAGSGGMAINHWATNEINSFYFLEELSDRAIPFLLFNLLIRGMNAVVIHVDALNRTSQGVFFIQNNRKYSNLNLMPYTKEIEEEFNITFTEHIYSHIREDYSKQLELALWEEKFDRIFNKVISQEIIQVNKTDKYRNKDVEEVLKDYDRATIVNKGILGIYPNQLEDELLLRKVKEVVELQGIKTIARIRV